MKNIVVSSSFSILLSSAGCVSTPEEDVNSVLRHASDRAQYLTESVADGAGGVECRYSEGASLSRAETVTCPPRVLTGPQGTVFVPDQGGNIISVIE